MGIEDDSIARYTMHWMGVVSLYPMIVPRKRAMVEGQTVKKIAAQRFSSKIRFDRIYPVSVKFLSLPLLCPHQWRIKLLNRAIGGGE
jgi:hypothetical protein